MKTTTSKIISLCLLAIPCALHAATWDNGGDQATWESANNWSTNTVPGTSGNLETVAEMSGVYNVSLTSAINAGALTTVGVKNGTTLTIGSGAVIGNLTSFAIDGIVSVGSTVNFDGGNWSQNTSGGLLTIGRFTNIANANQVSTFELKSGTISNLATGSAGRIEIGNGGNFGTAVLKVSGGSLTNSVKVDFQGETTGNAHFLISGGTVSLKDVNMNVDASDGFDSLIRVTGDAATITSSNIFNLSKNVGNLTGTSTAEFVFDDTGISKITTATLNLGIGAAKGLLDVDVTALDSDGTVAFNLFDYTTLTNGTFGSVSVNYGATALTLGTSFSIGQPNNGLAQNEYYLSYGDGSSDSIQLYYNVIPEPSTLALFGLAGVAVVVGIRRRRRG